MFLLNVWVHLAIIFFMINICVFEDNGFERLQPLTYARPVYDLRIGATTLFDKIFRYFDYGNVSLHCRPFLKNLVKRTHPGIVVNKINTGSPCLFINGRVILTERLFDIFSQNANQYDLLFTYQGQVVAAYLRGKCLDYMKETLTTTPASEDLIKYLRPKCVSKELDDIDMVSNLWDLVTLNGGAMVQDFEFEDVPGIIKGDVKPFASIYNENSVYVGKGSRIEDYVVINAESGPVYIEEDVVIKSGSYLEGPIYIGRGSFVLGARLKNTSVGKQCKVGGEISNSVLLDYSNKAHDGFLGDSYVGEWVNLGALTTTSNLKNTYGPVKLETELGDIQSDQIFLGAIIADHVKTGIGTLLNTGTVISFGSSIFGSEFHSKYIKPFSWGRPGKYDNYKLDAFFITAERVMARRGYELLDLDRDVFTLLHNDIDG